MRPVKQALLQNGEYLELPNQLNITLDELLENGHKSAKTKWFPYNASSSNCQQWIYNICEGNGLLTPEIANFIKQDTKSIFGKMGITRKIANTVVDLGKFGNILQTGGSIEGGNLALEPVG